MKFRHFFTKTNEGPSFAEYREGNVLMRLDFFKNMLRVALIKDGQPMLPTWSVCPDGNMPCEGRSRLSAEGFEKETPKLAEKDGKVFFELSGTRFCVELLNFRITAENETGMLYQDRSGLAYNFEGELGDGFVHYTAREEGQRIFGLGDKCGHVNKSGRSFAMWTGDSMGFKAESSDPLYKYLPFYICENSAGSYGLYYDTYSTGRMDFGSEHDNYFEPFSSARFEEESMVFYLILGTPLEIIRRFNAMCGGVAAVPEWAFRYCGSTMEYTLEHGKDPFAGRPFGIFPRKRHGTHSQRQARLPYGTPAL